MKIGFLVNDVLSEEAGFTTTRLGWEAVNQGHEVYVMGVGDLAYDPDESIRARARSVPQKRYGSHESYLKDFAPIPGISAHAGIRVGFRTDD